MDPRDNLVLASRVQAVPKGAPDEAAFRCACGRAYYAAFCIARDLLNAGGVTVTAARTTHQQVIDKLKSSSDQEVRGVGLTLESLHIQRKKADYDVGNSPRVQRFSQVDAQYAIAGAHVIVQALEAAAKKDRRMGVPV